MNLSRTEALQRLLITLNISGVSLDLVSQALTHPSYAVEHHGYADNQRLEFLGDGVVNLIVGGYLYEACPEDDEGLLTKKRATLICEASLAAAATKLGLGPLLLLGNGEAATGGAERASNLADAWEALCGAIYLEKGIEVLQPMVIHYLSEVFTKVRNGYYGDYKTRLQEFVQKTPGTKVTYHLMESSGPDHDKRFHIEVRVEDVAVGDGVGKSKKEAEQLAALKALIHYGVIHG